jgi:virginiamycin B lyase
MIWFDDGRGNQIVHLDTEGRVLDRITCDAAPAQRELLKGSGDTVIWYTDSAAKTLSRVSGLMEITSYLLNIAPVGLTIGPDQNLWVTEMNTAIHRVEVGENPTIMAFPAAPSNNIIVGPDANLWFLDNVNIARFNVTSGELQDFPLTDGYGSDLCVGPDQMLWFTDVTMDQIGRVDIEGRLSRTFDLPLSSKPFRIAAGTDGALWFTEQAAEKIGRITPSGEITHYQVPTRNSAPYGIAVGADGMVWFTELSSGKIGRLIPDSLAAR